jgi:1A family penicillin-binding protein
MHRYRRRKRIKLKNPLKRWNLNWGKIVLIGGVSGVVLLIGLFFWFSKDLPDPENVLRKTGFSSVILDREGEEILFDVYTDENRKFTPLEEMPDYLRQATIAVEDKDFYNHQGFDLMGMLRGFSRLFTRGRAEGGSTLTQQLVKNVLLTTERRVSRKVREFVLSVRIESRFEKDDILQMYLNEAPYGGTAWGVAAASEMYFGKEVAELNLAESVILAGLPQAPTRYSPYSSSKGYIDRAKHVARRMQEDGYIDEETQIELEKTLEDVEFRPAGASIKAPHFVMEVRAILEDMFGPQILERGGLKVTTTLDWGLQEKAQDIVAKEIAKVVDTLGISNGASVMIDVNSGDVLSMVGSRSFFDEDIDGEVNVVTRLRQPGSSIKPVVYATALLNGFTPASVLIDVETEFPGKDENTPYIPKNYDGEEHGPLHLKEALASSINIPAVKLLARVGVKEVLTQAYKMGMTSLEPTQANMSRLGLSMALGGGEVKLLELSSAYGAFANGGYKVEPGFILKVEDANGEVLFEKKEVKPSRVIDEKVAFLMNSMLSDNSARLITFGENSYLNLGSRSVAVKTGTTNDMRDNWTVGWTSDVVVGVWVGNNDNSPMKNVASGVSGAAPIWRKQMLDVLSMYPDNGFSVPEGVEEVEVDRVSGYPAHDGFAAYKEWVIGGTLPTGEDKIHQQVKVCKNDETRLANPVQVIQGNYNGKEFIVLKEDDPLTDKNLWQIGIDAWVSKQADDKYRPPTEFCESASGLDVQIISPKDRSRINSTSVEFRFEITSENEIDWVKLYLDGVEEEKFTSRPYTKKIENLADGQHEVKVLARDKSGKESDRVHEFGINEDWGATPTPTPTPTVAESE